MVISVKGSFVKHSLPFIHQPACLHFYTLAVFIYSRAEKAVNTGYILAPPTLAPVCLRGRLCRHCTGSSSHFLLGHGKNSCWLNLLFLINSRKLSTCQQIQYSQYPQRLFIFMFWSSGVPQSSLFPQQISRLALFHLSPRYPCGVYLSSRL